MNILLAVDVSDATEKALAFVGRVFAARDDVRITLFHVVERLPDHHVSERRRDRLRNVTDEWDAVASECGAELLEDARHRLVGAGVAEQNIECKRSSVTVLPESRRVSASLGIVEEMRNGNYDVVCLGRRGTSSAAGSFVGSVAQNVLREAAGSTVWIVD